MVIHTCNPCAGEADTREPRGLPASLCSGLVCCSSVREPVSQQKVKSAWDYWCQLLTLLCTLHTDVHTDVGPSPLPEKWLRSLCAWPLSGFCCCCCGSGHGGSDLLFQQDTLSFILFCTTGSRVFTRGIVVFSLFNAPRKGLWHLLNILWVSNQDEDGEEMLIFLLLKF